MGLDILMLIYYKVGARSTSSLAMFHGTDHLKHAFRISTATGWRPRSRIVLPAETYEHLPMKCSLPGSPRPEMEFWKSSLQTRFAAADSRWQSTAQRTTLSPASSHQSLKLHARYFGSLLNSMHNLQPPLISISITSRINQTMTSQHLFMTIFFLHLTTWRTQTK